MALASISFLGVIRCHVQSFPNLLQVHSPKATDSPCILCLSAHLLPHFPAHVPLNLPSNSPHCSLILLRHSPLLIAILHPSCCSHCVKPATTITFSSTQFQILLPVQKKRKRVISFCCRRQNLQCPGSNALTQSH